MSLSFAFLGLRARHPMTRFSAASTVIWIGHFLAGCTEVRLSAFKAVGLIRARLDVVVLVKFSAGHRSSR